MNRIHVTAFALSVVALTAFANAQLRVVQYNTGAAARPGLSTILQQIGNEQVNGFSKPIDVLLMQEVATSNDLTTVVNLLNGIYGLGSYASAPYVGQTQGGGLPVMIYRVDSVDLVGTTTVGTTSTSGNARQTIRYQLRPDGYTSSSDFFVYNSHFKAGNNMEGTDAARRNVEATSNRTNADALGPNRYIIYGGDLNLYGGNEAAFQTLISSGNGQAFDPINTPMNWRENNALRYAHTQSPATVSAYDGQVLGGMDDRFDFQLLSSAMLNSTGMNYITGSYRAFGNNGTHPLSGAINSGSNSWNPPGLTVTAATVKNALAQTSDHLPVVVDYQIPAKMSVDVAAVPERVIVDAFATTSFTVSNTAPVVASIGADRLVYSYSAGGVLSGAGAGTVNALMAPGVHQLAIDTSAVGVQSGSISVNTTSPSAANPNFSQGVSTTVLAHANGSFAPDSNADVLLLDLGIRARGSGIASASFSIFNRAHSSGFTAGLDLDSISSMGDIVQLSANIGTFTNLVAGGSVEFMAMLETANVGSFSTFYSIVTSDEDLPGAVAFPLMALGLSGRVALGGDADLDGNVNLTDFNILASNFGQNGQTWMSGDFDYDGLVNLNDFNILASNFGLSASPDGPTPDDWAALAAAVPEPGTLIGVLVLSGVSLLRRRTSTACRRIAR